MRKRVVGMMLAVAALAACGGDAPRGGGSAAAVDSGPAPTPALDSVGGTTPDQGRQD